MDVSVQVVSKFTFPLPFLLYSGPRWIECPLTLVRVIFTQSTDPNANLFWKHPHGYTQEKCFTCYLGIT